MRKLAIKSPVAIIAGAAAFALVASCTTDRIIYRSAQFPQPPAAAANFLGYSDTATHMTVCGNCHVDRQTQWAQTKHASAWADLEASGHANDACRVCHSVNNQGNYVTDTAVGWRSTHAARYHDVQCESCHGPGLTHVTSPSLSNRPLASLAVSVTSTDGCGECHNGTHHPFVEEWSLSAHATMPHSATPRRRGGECLNCHTGQGALTSWNVTTAYKEAGFANGDTLNITCGVCHDPHNTTNEHQLRWPINVADATQNLCMKCHQRNATALELDPSTLHGLAPHSPEGPLLLGTAGWWPPNMNTGGLDSIVGTHGSAANPGLCAGCHVNRFAVTDSASGNFVFQVTGHRFLAIPCLGTNGVPDSAQACTSLTDRSFLACTASGCHGSQDAARSAMLTAEQRIAQLDTALRLQLDSVLKLYPQDTAASNHTWTTASGALFNAQLAELPGSPVHNPFLIEALLTASIAQVDSTYGIPAPNRVSLNNILLQKYGQNVIVKANLRR